MRDLARDYAVKNNLTAFAHNQENTAGHYKLREFLKWHPELKVKKAEALSAACAQVVKEWIMCKECTKWYHQTCAEENCLFDEVDHCTVLNALCYEVAIIGAFRAIILIIYCHPVVIRGTLIVYHFDVYSCLTVCC